jgi:uncharacterized protein YdiU (UPF0061 family)
MHDSKVDFSYFFRQLSQIKKSSHPVQIPLRDLFVDRNAIDQWFKDYLLRLNDESLDDGARKLKMNSINPKYVLRNHLAQSAIETAKQGDFSEVQTLLKILSTPYDEQPQYHPYSEPPPADLEKIAVSCSS